MPRQALLSAGIATAPELAAPFDPHEAGQRHGDRQGANHTAAGSFGAAWVPLGVRSQVYPLVKDISSPEVRNVSKGMAGVKNPGVTGKWYRR